MNTENKTEQEESKKLLSPLAGPRELASPEAYLYFRHNPLFLCLLCLGL